MSDYAIRIGIGLAAVVVIATIGLIALSLVRRRISQRSTGEAADFSLAELRRLRDQGQISAEEFDRARARIVSQAQESLALDEPGKDRIGTKDRLGTDEPKMDDRR